MSEEKNLHIIDSIKNEKISEKSLQTIEKALKPKNSNDCRSVHS